MQLDETNPTYCVAIFSNHWMSSYFGLNFLPKFNNVINIGISKCQDMSASIGRKMIKHSLLESHEHDTSNGGCYITLASIDAELFAFFCSWDFLDF